MERKEAVVVLQESKRQNEIMRDNPSTFFTSKTMASGVDSAKKRIAALDMAIATLSQTNEPMPIEQLWKIDAPVWLSYNKLNGEKVGYWCLCKYGYIITPSGYGSYVNELPDWVFYRRPPEGEANA